MHILVENKLNELLEKDKLLSTKDYSFLLGRIYFTRMDFKICLFINQYLTH